MAPPSPPLRRRQLPLPRRQTRTTASGRSWRRSSTTRARHPRSGDEWIAANGEAFDSVTALTTDFLRAYLYDDEDALARLETEQDGEGTTLAFAAERGSGVTVPTAPPVTGRKASAEPTTNLTDGQMVTVSWSGFTPGKVVNIVQCAEGARGGNDICDLTKGKILQPNPTGEGSLQLEIIVGPVGTGTCDATKDDCVIVVNDAGLQDPEATVRIPISFAP